MNWNLFLLKHSTKKSQILLLVLFTDILLWMDLTDFNCNYLHKLLENNSKKQKSVFQPRNFNINLLNYTEHNQNNEFLDFLVSVSLIPLVLLSQI